MQRVLPRHPLCVSPISEDHHLVAAVPLISQKFRGGKRRKRVHWNKRELKAKKAKKK
jgi:hypothetical protein